MADLDKSITESDKTTKWVKTDDEVQLEKLLFHDASESFKEEPEVKSSKSTVKRKAAWSDNDDEDILLGEVKKETKHTGPLGHLNKEESYKEYLQNRFERITSAPKWADLDYEAEKDSDDELLTTVGFLQKSDASSINLKPDNLSFKKLKDLNRDTYAEHSITSIQFHPTSTAALVTGNSGVASIYAIDGTKNEKLHNIRFNNYPIFCAKLYDGGTKAIFGGTKPYFFSYDLMETSEKTYKFPKNAITHFAKFEISPCEKYMAVIGRFGEIHLLNLKSKELIHTFKQEETGTEIKFSKDSSKIYSHSSGSIVNILNIKTQRIEHTFTDEGCVHGSCLDIDPSGNFIATGSREGVVNLYKMEDVSASNHPKPIKTLYNLTTAISDVKFNSTSEILGFCSEHVPGAVKLLHCASGTVFSNFPGFQNKLEKINMIEFSPSSGYMALGSCFKEAHLYRLKHFKNY